jgi:hypothetical protein
MGRNDDLVAVVTGGTRGTGELTKGSPQLYP